MKTFFPFALLLVALVVVSGRTILDEPIEKGDARCSFESAELSCPELPTNYWLFDGKRCIVVFDQTCQRKNIHASKAECERICVDQTR
uniref:Putative secreted protein n=1 Tax=Ixodes ricinus TaxID=34613 RepID=A0A147BXC8_IXORI